MAAELADLRHGFHQPSRFAVKRHSRSLYQMWYRMTEAEK